MAQIDIKDSNPLLPILSYVSDLESLVDHQQGLIDDKQDQIDQQWDTISGLNKDLIAARAQIPTDRDLKVMALIAAARAYMFIKIPYKFGGEYPTDKAGDCSALTQATYGSIGIKIPRTSYNQATVGTEVAFDQLQPGDLVFFNIDRTDDRIDHVAIYIGDGNILHTNNPTEGIHIELLAAKYQKWMVTARRIIQ